MTKEENMQQDQNTQPEEDYVEGCHKENYMVPHVCPIGTGKWCRDYVKCKNLKGEKV